MYLSALLTSAGINIGICVLMFVLYSVLRKQPGNVYVYFGRRLAQENKRSVDPFSLERFVPSPSWLVKAWQTSEEDILAVAGLDAIAFIRMLVFSIRIFSIAAVVCIVGVLPSNYYGRNWHRVKISSKSLDAFTIANVQLGSRWLWVHCLALYIISLSACILLYFEYERIAKMRLAHITQSPLNPSHFTVLVRSIPWILDGTHSDAVKNFFMKYHASAYLSHQMVYRVGKVQRIMTNTQKLYKKMCSIAEVIDKKCAPLKSKWDRYSGPPNISHSCHIEHADSTVKLKECASAFVFFKNRYSALIATEILQSSNPMSWVTNWAPDPHDVYWSNLWIPYRQLWFRRIATLFGSIVFMFLFLIPVTFVQGLTQLDQVQQYFPFLKGLLKNRYVSQVVTGYLPSLILLLFLLLVPPLMMLFSAFEGSTSHSGRKKSACYKVLYFTIWNVFFVNVFSGSAISQIHTLSSPKELPTQLAKAVPRQATFFTTYVLTSGWASLSIEIIQLFPLIWILIRRYILRRKDDTVSLLSFAYHIEVPKVLLFGLLGFTCAILAPLILPFLVIYFSLGFIVYRNQILNVYVPKYETGGQMWPIAHNTTIFSLVLAQIIALGVFGLKKSPVAAGFIFPLVILTLLFNEFCRKRFNPVFSKISAQDFIDMDEKDEQSGKMDDIHQLLQSAYCQFSPDLGLSYKDGTIVMCERNENGNLQENSRDELKHPTLSCIPSPKLHQVVSSVRKLAIADQNKNTLV